MSPRKSAPPGEWEEHLKELRQRIILVLLVFCAATAVAFLFSDRIVAFLMSPLARFEVRLHTFAPTEKFMAHLHISVWAGIIFSAPFFAVQAALFLWPGLRGSEYRIAAVALFVVPVFFIVGAALCYRFLAPLAYGFFLSFGAEDGIVPLWGLQKYLALLFDLMIAGGLLLQMPLALSLLLALGIVSPQRVARYRPHIVLLIFFLAALLTPPDVISQILLGVPLYLLFEAALLIGGIFRK